MQIRIDNAAEKGYATWYRYLTFTTGNIYFMRALNREYLFRYSMYGMYANFYTSAERYFALSHLYGHEKKICENLNGIVEKLELESRIFYIRNAFDKASLLTL